MTNPVGRPLKFNSLEELQSQIDKYFDSNKKEDWTITGLAVALTTSRKVLMEYEEKDEYSNTIKEAKQIIEAEYERRAWNGAPPAMSIFALKNMGWRDKSESDITTKGESINPVLVKFIDGKSN